MDPKIAMRKFNQFLTQVLQIIFDQWEGSKWIVRHSAEELCVVGGLVDAWPSADENLENLDRIFLCRSTTQQDRITGLIN